MEIVELPEIDEASNRIWSQREELCGFVLSLPKWDCFTLQISSSQFSQAFEVIVI